MTREELIKDIQVKEGIILKLQSQFEEAVKHWKLCAAKNETYLKRIRDLENKLQAIQESEEDNE